MSNNNIIDGTDIDYTASNIVNAPGNVIIRNGFDNGTSNDTFPTADDLIQAEFGGGLSDNVGQSMSITITNANEQIYNINMKTIDNTYMVFAPESSFDNNTDVILHGQTKSYEFVVINSTTIYIFLTSTAVGAKIPGLSLQNAHIFIGDNDNNAQEKTMNGEGTLNTDGTFTLGDTIAGTVNFTNETESTSTIAGAVTFAGGITVKKNVFVEGTINVPTVTGLGDPTNEKDAVNKEYVDTLINGLSWKEYVKAVKTGGNFDLESAVGKTIDDVTLQDNDRFLLTDQNDRKQNGIWVANDGGPSTRPSDFPEDGNAAAAAMFVSDGVMYKDSAWVCTDTPPYKINKSELTFIRYSDRSGGITTINDQSGPTITMAAANVGTDFEVVYGGNAITYNLPNANKNVSRGVITNKPQTIQGAKTFIDPIILKNNTDIDNGGTTTLSTSSSNNGNYNVILPASQGTEAGEALMLSDTSTGQLEWKKPVLTDDIAYWYGKGVEGDIDVTDSVQNVKLTKIIDISANFSHVDSTLTFEKEGVYQISYWAQFKTSGVNLMGGRRSSLGVQLLHNVDNVDNVVDDSLAECYIRAQITDAVRPGAGKTILLDVDNGDTIQLQVLRTIGNTKSSLIANQCTLSVVRLGDSPP